MKNILSAFLLLVCLVIMCSCGVSSGQTGVNPSQNTQTSTSAGVVSVYDPQVNFVAEISFEQPTGNTIDVAQFAKVGYKFEGIYDMNRDIMLFNANGNQSPTIMLDTEFTAILKYSAITYQFVFDAGEGKLASEIDYSKLISYEEVIEVFPNPILEGKEFSGWFDGAGNRFSNGSIPIASKLTADGFVLPEETIQLYARYETKYCDVRLVMQDGSSDVKLQVEYGQKLPDMTQYLKDDGNRVITGFGVSPSSLVAFEDVVYTDLDLYALWKEYKYINFVYSDTQTQTVKVYSENNLVTLPDGQRPGYEFEGWYSSPLLSGNKIKTIPFIGMADTYYAKWSVGNYTIRFVAGGTLVSSSNFNIFNTDIRAPQVPEKQHYIGKWEDYTLEFKDIVVNAVYEPEQMAVTLLNGAEYTYHTVAYGEMYTLNIPTKAGHNFTGWYYKGKKLTDEQGNSLMPYTYEDAITMTAGWEAKICTLYFETNGGNSISQISIPYGQVYTLTQMPVRSGFRFDGWYDEAMENQYVKTVTITSDTVLFAKWIKSTPVSTAQELRQIAANPSGNYYLTADIDLKGGDWTPIENFTGILDGNGFTINNFSLRQNGVDLGFVIHNNGIIKNITFSNVDISSTISGKINCTIGVATAHNAGKMMDVKVEKVAMLVNISSYNVYQNVYVGCIVGENTGEIRSCAAQAEVMFKASLSCYGWGDNYTSVMGVGGAVGINKGTISQTEADVFVDANEYVSTDCYVGDCYENSLLNIGGISGIEYGNVFECMPKFTCQLFSNAGGDSQSRRYTRIGGVVGSCAETASITNCYSEGNIAFKRVGKLASYEMCTGGIVGKIDSGTVNNCASAMKFTVQEGYGGTMGGIVGLLGVNGKVSNVAYYGEMGIESYTGGWFGGLAGQVNGWLTKGYFDGKITFDATSTSDIAAVIDTSGSISKTIGNGGTGRVLASGRGSSISNYLIGIDYTSDVLYNRALLFEDLGLFESDNWNIDDVKGLYLISFPRK